MEIQILLASILLSAFSYFHFYLIRTFNRDFYIIFEISTRLSYGYFLFFTSNNFLYIRCPVLDPTIRIHQF